MRNASMGQSIMDAATPAIPPEMTKPKILELIHDILQSAADQASMLPTNGFDTS
jgi:hypothetical protein